jgi:hypothetical protein
MRQNLGLVHPATASRNVLRINLAELLLFLILTLITITWASTTVQSYHYLKFARNVLIGISIPLLLLGLVRSPQSVTPSLATLLGLSALSGYSWFLAGFEIPSAELIEPTTYFTWITLNTSAAIALFLRPRAQQLIPQNVAVMYTATAFLVLFATIAMGGLSLKGGLPKFLFEFETAAGSRLTYSQGISKFYGLAAIFSALMLSSPFNRDRAKSLKMAMLGAFLTLSFIGGGRGDFVSAALTSALALGAKRLLIGLSIAAIGVFVFQDAIISTLAEYTGLLDRYGALTSTFGRRTGLFYEGVELLAKEPSCLLFGGGIGYFQHYFDYPPGMYPHNIVLECVISFGILIVAPIAYFTARGLAIVYREEGKLSGFLAVFVFLTLISFKSGSIITFHPLPGFVAFLCVKGITDRQFQMR